jgi:hypothetical protein
MHFVSLNGTKMPIDNPFIQDTAIIININKKRASISTYIRLTRKEDNEIN